MESPSRDTFTGVFNREHDSLDAVIAVKIVPFEQENWQREYENTVEYNLSESSVHPLTTQELIGEGDVLRQLIRTPLGYPQGDGTRELKSAIAATYGKLPPENVLVTVGSSEANFAAAWHVFDKGDELVLMTPNYAQVEGLARNWGLKIKPLRLREELGWQFDPEDLKKLVTKKTKAVQVCNPDNPTGSIMGAEQRKALIDSVKDSGAWLLSDEIYLGAEREGSITESLWGHHEKTLISNGLSKAYGLAGLRIGWLVGSKKTVDEIKSYRDYTTLAPMTLSDRLAQVALEPGTRSRILERTRGIIRNNYPKIRGWLDSHGSLFSHVPPAAGAICYVKYGMKINSMDLAQRLRKEKSVLVVPGDHFSMDGYVRIGIGMQTDRMLKGLERIDELLKGLKKTGG